MGRRKKVYQLTQEQIDWRNRILKRKRDSVVQSEIITKPVLSDDKIKKCLYYINNCVFWVNEYIDGKVDKDRLLETAKALQGNAKDLELLLT